MPSGKYLVAINGFSINAETWDDAFEWDGKRDELFLSTSVVFRNVQKEDQSYSNQPTSPVIGDTNNHNGRIQGGSASSRGGLRTGDVFPHASPWQRTIPLSQNRNWPPCAVWEGELRSGQDVVFITPTIWEWDPGQHFVEGWVDWLAKTDAKFGARAKEIVTGAFPVAGPIFDAISLGLQTAATLFAGGPIGSSGSRPIGFKATGEANKFEFNPKVIVLTYELAEQICNSQPAGLGVGVLSLRYDEHPYFRGDVNLYIQIEKTDAGNDQSKPKAFPNGSLWREQSDPKVYVTFAGAKFWIPDPNWLFRIDPRGWDAVKVVPDGSLHAVPVVPNEGTLFREWSSAPVYVMLNGQRRWVRDIPALDKYTNNERWTRVHVVPDGGLNQTPQGSPAP